MLHIILIHCWGNHKKQAAARVIINVCWAIVGYLLFLSVVRFKFGSTILVICLFCCQLLGLITIFSSGCLWSIIGSLGYHCCGSPKKEKNHILDSVMGLLSVIWFYHAWVIIGQSCWFIGILKGPSVLLSRKYCSGYHYCSHWVIVYHNWVLPCQFMVKSS